MRTDHTDAPAGGEYATIYLAFELSKAKWQLGIMMPGAEKMSRYRIDGGDMAALSGVLLRARGKAAQEGKPVVSYPAMRRGSTVIGCTAGGSPMGSAMTSSEPRA